MMLIVVASPMLLDELLTGETATELLLAEEVLDGVLLRDDTLNEEKLLEDRLSDETLNEEALNEERLEETLLALLLTLEVTEVALLDTGLELLLPPPPPPPQATSKLQVATVIAGVTRCLSETNFLVKKSCDKKE